MTLQDNDDPRPKERAIWIEKFRKVKPVNLIPPATAQKTRSSIDARKSTVTSGLEPYTGLWQDAQVAHLTRRTLFGVKKSDLNYFKTLTMDQSVNHILTASPLPSQPVNDYQLVDPAAIDPNVALGESWVGAPHGGDKEGYRVMSLKGWVIKNMLLQENTIHEKMKFFWSNLLVTKVWDVYIAKTSYQYFQMLHNRAFGNYKLLMKAVTLDSSMLIFLNGASNKKDAPDENYGRELQELFCVGKGPNSHYTEEDVKAAARVLTGWQINWDAYSNPGSFYSHFEPTLHDTSDKQFSSFYDNKLITGKTGSDGAGEIDELLDMIIGNEESSRYICRRLYTFFVYSEIDDATEQNVIVPLAEIFRSNNYEILPVLNAIFKSTHFYDSANYGALIKNPLDHLIGIWRCLGVTSPVASDLVTNYQEHTSMLWNMAGMGLEVGDPPNVAGWTAYYQAPQFDETWINTDTITQRALTTDSLIYWGFWISANLQTKADLPGFASQLQAPGDPVSLLKESARLLLGMDLSDTTINNLKTILLSGLGDDAYWTTAWNAYIGDTGNADHRQTIETRLQSAFRSMLQLGEYQLM